MSELLKQDTRSASRIAGGPGIRILAGAEAARMGTWGIDDRYADLTGRWHETSPETRAALLAAMGIDPETPAPAEPPVRVIPAGQSAPISAPAELRLEDGTVLRVEDAVPPDLPLGYHDLCPLDGGPAVRLIVSPLRCFLPEGLRTWGWVVQLYTLRSAASWGMGDLDDLARLNRWSAGLGAGIVLVSPLSASNPLVPQEASPYFASSRRFRNPLYLHIESVPGADAAGLELDPIVEAGRALNRSRYVERDAVFQLKRAALELLWNRFAGDAAFDAYCVEQGSALREFATYCALAEHHGCTWHHWPTEHQRPHSAAVARFAAEHVRRVRYHQWQQWLLDRQLARAAAALPIMHDLPIGVDPNGADAWAWQGVLATGVTVGAPPDDYSTEGQNWSLPPFVPHKLRAARYEPFIQTIRANLRRAGALRIDHVMGLFRLFWIPENASPGAGTYVRYPAEDLLAIVALESHRARAFIVGEDLGTVEPGVREQLAERNVLSYRLLWFEPRPPEEYPELALAAVTTHDLPTIAGLWSRADMRHQQEIGLQPNARGMDAMRERLRAVTGVTDDVSVPEIIARTHQALSRAPSAVITATLDDTLAVEERPNIPGTMRQWPNWRLALPKSLEALERDPLARAVAGALARDRLAMRNER